MDTLMGYKDFKSNFKVRNKLYALYKCLYHWEYLAISGSDDKDDFFDIQKNPSYYTPSFTCFCCDSAQVNLIFGKEWTFGTRDCRKCPLGGYAWKIPTRINHVACNTYDENDEKDLHDIPFSSLFDYWCEVEERARMASRMVRVIKEAISDIELKRLRRR